MKHETGDKVSQLFGTSNVAGRSDGGQEQVVRVPKADKISHLIKLHKAFEEAKVEFSDGCKAVAEKAGMDASVVRRYVIARAGEKYAAARAKSQQLQMLFDQLGEG